MAGLGSDLFVRLPLLTEPLVAIGITLTRVPDGTGIALVGRWPLRAAFSVELLDYPSPGLVVSEDSIRVFCVNACATYHAIGRDDLRRTVVGELRDWEIAT